MNKRSGIQATLTKSKLGKLIAPLFLEKPWLAKRSESFFQLMATCKDDEEMSLILDLINRFVSLNFEEVNDCLIQIKDKIFSDWSLNPHNTQLVAISPNYEPDSSEIVVGLIKSVLGYRLGSSVKLINRFSKCIAFIQRRRLIVFIDEFIGTGDTLVKRIDDTIKSAYNDKGLRREQYSIYVCALATMVEGRRKVSDHVDGIYTPIMLDRGISSHYGGRDLRRAIRTMLRLECTLGMYAKRMPPSFGYGRSEALYCAEYWSVPNNVFPIFWWPNNHKGELRDTLFTRVL